MLEHLHINLPNCELSILVRKGNEVLYENHPYLKKVFVWQKKTHKYKSLAELVLKIRSAQFDSVINLQRHTASAFMTVCAGAKTTIGFSSNWLSLFFSDRIRHRIANKGDAHCPHEVQRCIALTRHLAPERFTLPRLYPSIQDFNVTHKYTQKPFITISPSSVWATKQAPSTVWQRVIERHTHVEVYVLGGPDDLPLCEALAAKYSNTHVLAGQLTLLQSAALMSLAQMNYTNDSAPMHLCSAMNAPVTAIFCSTVPEFGFGPLSSVSRIVQTSEVLACRPCGIHGHGACPKGHFKCGAISDTELFSPAHSA